MGSPDSEHGNPADVRIVEEIERQLAKKGLQKAESSASELLVCYHSNFGTEQIKKYTMTEGETSYSFTIQTGRVAIDMFDSATEKPVWRNAANINPKARSQDVTKAVSKLLATYPPKQKQSTTVGPHSKSTSITDSSHPVIRARTFLQNLSDF